MRRCFGMCWLSWNAIESRSTITSRIASGTGLIGWLLPILLPLRVTGDDISDITMICSI